MAESMATRKLHGVTRVLAKLDSSIKAGNYYEAHQMYRTLYFRYLRQEKYIELLQMLYDGSVLLLNHGQQASGADLANLYVDVLVKSNTEPSEQHINNISELFGLISRELTERDGFLSAAIQWSARGQHKAGHPYLHELLARVFWKEKNYVMARRHFLHSRDGFGFATMLVELHKSNGYTNEVDLFIAQVVLQFLCLQNKSTAIITFESYTTQHPYIDDGPPYYLPLLNFIWFLLKAIDSGRLGVFTVLCEEYQVSIKRDPSYTEYLDKIAQIFFGVPPPRNNNSRPNFIGNLLHSLMNGVEDMFESDAEDDRESTVTHPHVPPPPPPMETETLD